MKLKAKFKSKQPAQAKSNPSFAVNLLKGVLIALFFSLISILLFAFVLKFTNISESVITPVNQIIKGLSVFFGVSFALKKQREMGLVSGLLIGFIYTFVAFVVFSILGGHFNFDLSLLVDGVFSAIVGGICGIICVNLKKNSH